MSQTNLINEQEIKAFLAAKKSQMTTQTVLIAIKFLKTEQYQIQSLINCGGQGLIFKAINLSNRSVFAIKLLIIQDKDALKQVQKEFQLCKQFYHPNINKCHTSIYDEVNEMMYIISDFCTFGDLFAYKEKRSLTKGEIIHIMKSIIKGMIEIHSKNIIHSDLKPQNILIDNHLNFQICDFGLSKMLSKDKSHTDINGLSYYYSPQEQDQGTIQLESDIYSLGMILLFLCGINFFNYNIVAKLKSGNFSQIRKDGFDDILQISFQMMNTDPKKRLKLIDSISLLDTVQSKLLNKQQDKDRKYLGEMQKNKRHGWGELIYDDGSIFSQYIGSWRNGKKYGLGILQSKSGNTYVGWWKDDSKEGQAIQSNNEGNRYEGNFKNNKLNGNGIWYYPNGNIYEGVFKNNVKDGKGIMYYSNRDRYEGGYKQNNKNGKGKFYYSNGNMYDGDYRNNNKDGKGIMQYYNGNRFEGFFKNDLKHGKGIMYYSNGNRYEGSFSNNIINGRGIMYFSNGNKYEGDFKNNVKHGKGIMYYSNGDKYEGDYKNKNKEGKGIFYFSNGNRYEGDFNNNMKDGKGILYYSNGSKYEGQFKNNKINGKGIWHYSNGNRYEGDFKNNLKDGQGIIYYSNGDRCKQQYKNGVKEGKDTWYYSN